MKLEIGQTVYYITESFEPEYHFRIAKCKVKSVPYGNMKEYCILENRHMYWNKRQYIYDTYREAVENAEKMADHYDSVWEEMEHKKILRPWRKRRRR